MHRLFRKRMLTAMDALDTYISSDWADWSQPQGGFLLWLRLKPLSSPPEDWDRFLASHGVQVAHGRRFFHTEPAHTYLRLSISSLDEAEIVEGIRRLSRALHHAHTGKDK
jgi:DNA-binding transcriptional MocR family regulator